MWLWSRGLVAGTAFSFGSHGARGSGFPPVGSIMGVWDWGFAFLATAEGR